MFLRHFGRNVSRKERPRPVTNWSFGTSVFFYCRVPLWVYETDRRNCEKYPVSKVPTCFPLIFCVEVHDCIFEMDLLFYRKFSLHTNTRFGKVVSFTVICIFLARCDKNYRIQRRIIVLGANSTITLQIHNLQCDSNPLDQICPGTYCVSCSLIITEFH